jgi:hypothetical protein
MSHSPDKRKENKESALSLMATKTEDRMILTTHFWPTDEDFKSTFETSWAELQAASLIEEAYKKEPIAYRLTGTGWIAGLRLTPLWESAEFRKKAGQLSQTLKASVKGRKEDELALLSEITKQSGLREGFVFNAIDSHLLRELFDISDAEWDPASKSHVIIPKTFGLPLP